MSSKVRIVQDGIINQELRSLLLSVRINIRTIADLFVEENVDEAEAVMFVSQMLLSEMKKSTERKNRELEMVGI